MNTLDSSTRTIDVLVHKSGANHMPLDVAVVKANGSKSVIPLVADFEDTVVTSISKERINEIQIDPEVKLRLLSRYKLDSFTV